MIVSSSSSFWTNLLFWPELKLFAFLVYFHSKILIKVLDLNIPRQKYPENPKTPNISTAIWLICKISENAKQAKGIQM